MTTLGNRQQVRAYLTHKVGDRDRVPWTGPSGLRTKCNIGVGERKKEHCQENSV